MRIVRGSPVSGAFQNEGYQRLISVLFRDFNSFNARIRIRYDLANGSMYR